MVEIYLHWKPWARSYDVYIQHKDPDAKETYGLMLGDHVEGPPHPTWSRVTPGMATPVTCQVSEESVARLHASIKNTVGPNNSELIKAKDEHLSDLRLALNKVVDTLCRKENY